MTEYPDEPGTWWTEFPGSDRAAWATPSLPSPGDPASARGGVRPAASDGRLKHRLAPISGRRERARRVEMAEWRRQRIAAIREPSLKSGVITVGSGFGGTGKTDVAVTLAAIYAAARPSDRVILADSNDDMPHGYIRLGGATVEDLPQHRRPLSIRGFHQACVNGRINVYADLRDAVAWLQGVAVIRGDTADESVGVDFGEHEYLTVLGFLQCMSNIVINDGGTGLFAKLQVGTLLHGDKLRLRDGGVTARVLVDRPGVQPLPDLRRRKREATDRTGNETSERAHGRGDGRRGQFCRKRPGAGPVARSDPESYGGAQVSVVATPWDQSLANRVALDLSAVADSTLTPSLRWPRLCCAAPIELTEGARGSPRKRRKAPATPSGIQPSRPFGSRSPYHRLLTQPAQKLNRTPWRLTQPAQKPDRTPWRLSRIP